MSTLEVFHISESKKSGFQLDGFSNYKITFSSGKKFFFQKSNGYFAVSGRYWTDRSFEELIKNHNKGCLYVQSYLKNRNIKLFNYVVFSDEEIEEAIKLWNNKEEISK